MAQLRSATVDLDTTPYYHCVSRCVRRAFLCGSDPYTGESYEHRKEWLVQRLRTLSELFAVQVCAYAVMSNHFHLVLRVDRELARSWSDAEVLERVGRLFPGRKAHLEALSKRARHPALAQWRERLSSLSWMMRALNEHIARRANREDQCTGRFWEGRFKSQPLLDEQALLTCMSYVDLNPVRAGVAARLEQAHFTSIQQRLQLATDPTSEPSGAAPPDLMPFADQVCDPHAPQLPMGFDDYVELLQWTGRSVVRGRAPLRGPAPVAMARLAVQPHAWLSAMSLHGLERFAALGTGPQLQALAQRNDKRWVRGTQMARRLFHAA